MNIYVKKIERTYLQYFLSNLLSNANLILLDIRSYQDDFGSLEYVVTYKNNYEIF